MARPKNPAEALGNDEPTRLFHSPISDDELTLGEGRTMAVAPEDNEALLNELLATSVIGPSVPAPQVSAPAPPNRRTSNGRIPVPGKMTVPGRLPARPVAAATSPASAASADGPAAKEGSVRGWSVNLDEQTQDKPRGRSREAAHPADSEQHTVALPQLDAPTVAFKPQGAMREPQKVEAQRMMGTQPLAVYGAPNVHVTQPAAPPVKVVMPSQGASNAKAGSGNGSGTVKMPPDASSPAQLAQPAIAPIAAIAAGNASQAHASAMAATMPAILGPPSSNPGSAPGLASGVPQSSRQVGAQSSGAMQAVPQSAPQMVAAAASGPHAAIPRIVPGAQKMPPLDLPNKRGGNGFSTLMFTTVACAAVIAAFFAYRSRGATAPPSQGAPVAVAAQNAQATGAAGVGAAGAANQGDRVSVPVIQVAQQPSIAQPGAVGAAGSLPVAAVGAGGAAGAQGTATNPVGGAIPGAVPGSVPGAGNPAVGGVPGVVGASAPGTAGSNPVVAAAGSAAPASTGETHRKHRVAAPTDDGSKSGDDAKTADGSGDAKTAKGGKGAAKGDAPDKTAAPSSTAEEEEMKKATETLSNSL